MDSIALSNLGEESPVEWRLVKNDNKQQLMAFLDYFAAKIMLTHHPVLEILEAF